MQLYIFNQHQQLKHQYITREIITNICHHIAENTDTSCLVTALYLMPGIYQTRGAYLRRWMNENHFQTGRGKWAFTRHFPIPEKLPEQFRLIRMRMDGRTDLFPREDQDAYGWRFKYHSFEDHLATLFAHELHHYRRYHLNLHPNEGEHGANRWALSHVQALGYEVTGQRVHKKQKRKSGKLFNFLVHDPFKNFRHLKAGDSLIIKTDPRQTYTNQTALIMRPIRGNSKRIVIKTTDGKQWRWPMSWLSIEKD